MGQLQLLESLFGYSFNLSEGIIRLCEWRAVTDTDESVAHAKPTGV